jgi:hypothetical protein
MATTTNFGWTTPNDTDLVKDGAAAIRTALNGVDTSFVDLKGGTTGQVLSKTSNTDLDFTWITDATGMTNPMTTTGDVIYSSSGATPARLGIGTDGQVLKVSSGLPSWGSASVPANFSLANAGGTALSGSQTVTVSGLSNVGQILVFFAGANGPASSETCLRINTDTGSNYNAVGLVVQPAGTYNVAIVAKESDYIANPGNRILLAQKSGNASSTMEGAATIFGCNSAGLKIVNACGSASASTGNNQIGLSSQGFYSGTSVVSSVSVFNSGGNFTAGTLYVYTSA